MPKKRFTDDQWRTHPWFRALCSALSECKTDEEVANFLRDIGSLSELQAWSERFEIAKLLSRGMTYRRVAANTGASTTTVTRVAKFLENGEGGFRKILNVKTQVSLQKKGPQTAQEIKSSLVQKYLQKAPESPRPVEGR